MPRDLSTSALKSANHVAHREQAALGGDEPEEIGREAGDADGGENGVQRLHLLLGREDRAADEALHVGLRGDELVEAGEIGRHGVDRAGLLRQLE